VKKSNIKREITMSKQDLLSTIYTEVATCRKCNLWKSRKNTVAGDGSINATVLFIGEAPGYWEDIKGHPFVGAAGKLLDEMLLIAGLSRSEVYISNLLKCRPPENRDPLPVEVETCTPFLDKQIQIIEPKLIVTLGRHSTSYILSKAGFKEVGSITKLREKIYDVNLLGLSLHVMPTYHPAAALYNARYKSDLENDFQLLKLELEKRR
jgi:uracil-DNA glycosylase family 4